MAMEHSYAMQLQSAERDKASHQYREALAGALPQISAEASAQRYLLTPEINGFSLNREYETSYGITVTQPIYKFGALRYALEAAEKTGQLQEISQDVVRKEISYATRLSYYTVRLAEQQLEIANKSLQNARSNLALLEQKFAGGRPPHADVIRLKADIARRAPEVTSAQSRLDIALTRLKILLGLDHGVEIKCTTPLADKFTLTSRSNDVEQLEKQPQVKVLQKTIELQESLVNVKKVASMPSIGAFYSYNMRRLSDSGMFSPESNVQTSIVGLSVSWPIWDGGGNRARYHQALVDKSKAEISLAQKREELLTEMQAIRQELESTQKNLADTRAAIKLAEQSFKLSQQRFQTGRTSVMELNDTESALTMTRQSELALIYKLNELKAKWSLIVEGLAKEGGANG